MVSAVATLPPTGLAGLRPEWSRLVEVAESGAPGVTHGWHVLDNGAELDALGVIPVGTILCVHGNPTWSYLWRSLLSAATDAAQSGAPAWRVIAVDQLDMGFSARTGGFRPLARRVRDLGDLTDALDLTGPVITLGHDWGGVVSLGWAVDHSDLLSGVMLLNTAVHQPAGDQVPAPLRLALARGILGPATVATPAFLATTLNLAHPPLSTEVKRGYRAPYRTSDRRGGIGGFVADIPVALTHESRPELDRIAEGARALTVPTLLLWGPRDPIFSDRYLDDLVERMPHARVHRFEGAGHLLAEDADYAAAALLWLGDAAAPAPLAEPVETAVGAPAAAWEAAGTHPLWHYLNELQNSDDTALVDMLPAPRRVSWRLLSRRVRQIGAGLVHIGVKPGDRVSLLVPPSADLTAVLYACVRIGAIVVVADAGLGLAGLTRAVRGARPDFVIGAAPGLMAARALGWPGRKISVARFPAPMARLLGVEHTLAELIDLGQARLSAGDDLPPEPAPSDPAAVLFTSGSTGPAKGVVYTHGQLSAVSRALFLQYGVGVGTGLVAGFAPFALLGPALGARSVTPDMDVTAPKTLTATAVAAAVAAAAGETRGATVVFLSPAALVNVVATAAALEPADHAALAGVQRFLSAGAPISESLLAQAAALMPHATAHTPYGMTEGLLMADITLDGIREAAASIANVPTADAAAHDGESATLLQTAVSTSSAAAAASAPAARESVSALNPAGGVCVGGSTATTRIRISALDASGASVGELSVEPDVTGEIVVSAPHVKDHYDRLWLTERASRRGAVEGERWHRTGDVGHLDSAGRLWVEGRMPHVIVTADGVVTPVGPEQRIESLAEVSRAAFVGVGPVGTQQQVAVVETVPPARRVHRAPEPLAAAVRARVGTPVAAVLVVPGLPTDIRHNSKIDRSRLSRWATGILSGGRWTQP
ncbi:alpha/beta fold hydrolase [Cryobacterium sp. TMT1-3]|uniref:Alpha/beta fold hydrolase n=1 Tax=Cryobacterium luteum TaxID=1424661 RepID=A0A1H8AYI0_9MICO|nr:MULTISPECIES: alpha/beta fold hydrolase [Cryobacterium]TFB88776.1 alpha/beta fold hydrolase [Cryobacterium luteum]TFC24823.1 alpha/beta fold hydrolase [Cryobacterium sp. TMT1-3]SEM75802.1 Acyl-CoA synthetase (AMP-forming)/AMP-acid ligase II [Cryobacterium luteum]